MIHYTCASPSDAAEIEELFINVFTDSEGPAEGEMIGRLVRDFMNQTPEEDLYCFVARDAGRIVGGIFFSRITFESETKAFILGPVAVQSRSQGQGIGLTLIRHGLDQLSNDEVELAITYGDPRFYSKVGFQVVSPETIPAPLPLQFPEGWQAQSLQRQALPSIPGKSSCVEALNHPAYW
jgi:putative acetyltransferase